MSASLRNGVACIALSVSLTVLAQQTMPAPAGGTGMDMPSMPGMTQDPTKPAANAGQPRPAPASSAAMDVDDMDMSSMPDMDHGQSHDVHAMPSMRMQGGTAQPDARGADYSDGVGHGDMAGMDMRDAEPLGMLRFDQIETFDGLHGRGQAWEMEGWYGTDADKLWLRSEGERESGTFDDSDVEALWSHAVAAYWNTQLGVRNDFGGGPSRQWLALGVQGLAPYWFELAATAYASPSGRAAARLRADYELLFTQRWILQPELEVNLYGRTDPQRRLGRGLSDASLGLRLRYEIRRQFAPYLGAVWTQRFGGTAAFARADGKPVSGLQWVAGVRVWF